MNATQWRLHIHISPSIISCVPKFSIPLCATFLLEIRSSGSAANDKDQRKFGANVPSNGVLSVRRVLFFLKSREIVNFLETLTGIEGLIPDPHNPGGGCHELRPGGFLKVHADFNWHTQMRLDRRINLLNYLNKDWQPEYGGNLELWDGAMSHKQRNTLRCSIVVIFNITDKLFHGNPTPVTCPPDRTRRSLAFYYYTNGRPAGEVSQSHGTLFKNRPGEATVANDRLFSASDRTSYRGGRMAQPEKALMPLR